MDNSETGILVEVHEPPGNTINNVESFSPIK